MTTLDLLQSIWDLPTLSIDERALTMSLISLATFGTVTAEVERAIAHLAESKRVKL